MASSEIKLIPNPNHTPEAAILANSKSPTVWTGERRSGKKAGPRPGKGRIAKEAQYRTGGQRLFQRHSGSGRPLNEPPKKSGAGGHNWGWYGIEIGVELASKNQLRNIDRVANPVAPAQSDEAWEEAWEEAAIGTENQEEAPVSWEWHIAGGARRSTGYWTGLESVRTLFGDEAPADNQESELCHADFLSFASAVVRDYLYTHGSQEVESERKLALKLGGPPKYFENIAWGDKEAEQAFFTGVPVIPWGDEEDTMENSAERKIPKGNTAPVHRRMRDRGRMPQEGSLGLEAERLMGRHGGGGSKEPASKLASKNIITSLKLSSGVDRQGRRGSAVENERDIDKMVSEGGRAGFNTADSTATA
jgi:hypothetical protein